MNSCDTRTLPPKTQHHDKRVKKRSITNQPNGVVVGLWEGPRFYSVPASNPPSVCTSGFVAVGSAMHVAITAISLLQRCLSHQPERRSPGPRSARNSSLWLLEQGRNREAAAVCFLGLRAFRPRQCVECPFWHSTKNLHLPLSREFKHLHCFSSSSLRWNETQIPQIPN